MKSVWSAIVAATIAGAGLAGGQNAPLAGPRVEPAVRPPSIVERGFDGSVKVPEPTPEQAVLALLDLDGPNATDDQRASKVRIDAVLSERAAFLDEMVAGNIPLLTMLGGADAAEPKEKLALAWAAWQKVKPLREKGLLQDQIRALLTPEDRLRFDGLLKNFWNAIITDRAAKPKADGKKPGRIEIIAAVRFESFGKELERSFYRVVQSGRLLFEYATKDLKLSREQEQKLRELAAEHARKGDNATEQDNRRLFLAAIFVLDEEQRPRFIRNLSGK